MPCHPEPNLQGCDIKPLFIQGPFTTPRLVALVCLSVVMMVIDHRQEHLTSLRAALSLIVYPIYYVVNAPVTTGEWLTGRLATRAHLMEENQRLHRLQLELQAKLQRFAALQAENARLRELLESSSRVPEKVLIAELMAVDPDPFSHRIVINRGSRHGVYEGQPLLDAHGVTGQVVSVTPFSSTAMLITDVSHALPVQVNRNGLRAVAVGTGKLDQLELTNIPDTADIQAGDLLVTSGLGGRFPAGYPVATVTSVKHDPGLTYARVVAKPAAHLERIREVLLVLSGEHETTVRPPATGSADDGPAEQP